VRPVSNIEYHETAIFMHKNHKNR